MPPVATRALRASVAKRIAILQVVRARHHEQRLRALGETIEEVELLIRVAAAMTTTLAASRGGVYVKNRKQVALAGA